MLGAAFERLPPQILMARTGRGSVVTSIKSAMKYRNNKSYSKENKLMALHHSQVLIVSKPIFWVLKVS